MIVWIAGSRLDRGHGRDRTKVITMARRRVMMHIALLVAMMLLFGVVTLAMMLVAVEIAIAMAMVR